MAERKRARGDGEDRPRPGTKDQKYVLRLYVAGMTPNSKLAIENIQRLCNEHLKGRYELKVVNVYLDPVLAQGEQIIAAPTLIKELPLPLRKFIGTMANEEKILIGLDLRPRPGS